MITQSQILESLASLDEGLTRKQVKTILTGLADLAYREAKNGFVIPGLGKLVLVKRAARMGRNPATGETIKIPAKTVLKFRVSKAAKDAVLGAAPAKKSPSKGKGTGKAAGKTTRKR